MPYTYFLSGSPTFFKTQKESLVYDFETNLTAEFYNASDVFTIQEEATFASGVYSNTDVRINTAIDNITGVRLGDDFKSLLFLPSHSAVTVGTKFQFDSNYWLVINANSTKSLVNSAMVRRCNSYLKWTDNSGNTYTEPCVIDYKIATPDNKARTDPIISEGTIQVICQLNTNTDTIQENQRFLFGRSGNYSCYRLYGGGLNNWLQNITTDATSGRILSLAMGKNFVNEDTDDLINGIADAYRFAYALVISPSAITGGPGDSYLLTGITTLNDTSVSKPITYTSSSPTATVSGCVVTLVSAGSCVITGCLTGNTAVSDTVQITISAAVTENDIRILPVKDYVLQGDTQTWSCYNYNNGVVGADAFTFVVSGSAVSGTNYALTSIDDNHFSIRNIKMYLDWPITITCTSGSLVKAKEITLKGAW